MGVTASLVINFGDEKDAFLEAEINEDDNDGKTTFVAGDEVKFRIYHSGNYTVMQTTGSSSLDSSNISENNIIEQVSFAFSATSSTDKLITGINSYSWIGKTLGAIQKSNYNEVSGGKADDIGVASINYNSQYDLWTYSSPADINGSTTYTVVIGITATI